MAENTKPPRGTTGPADPEKPECFVVMPISDPEGYPAGHFGRVFADIFCPACEHAGYKPVRADDIRETNLIHLDVLQRLLNSPIVLVDLSSRNPNVLFELGLRQAFDKPVVLVQEVGTPKIFDIAPLRYTEYRRARIYDEVLIDQREIANALIATREAFSKGAGVNSIVRILSLTRPASLPELQDANRDPVLQLIRAELSELRMEVRRSQSPVSVRSMSPDEVDLAFALEIASATVRELEARAAIAKASGKVDKDLERQVRAQRRVVQHLVEGSPRHPDTVLPHFIENTYRRIVALEREIAAGPSAPQTGEDEGAP